MKNVKKMELFGENYIRLIIKREEYGENYIRLISIHYKNVRERVI